MNARTNSALRHPVAVPAAMLRILLAAVILTALPGPALGEARGGPDERDPWVEVELPGRAPVRLAARLIEGGRYVSSLDLLAALGLEGEWRPREGALDALVGRKALRLRAGSRNIEYGDRTLRLARAPVRVSDELLVPEEFIGPLRAAFIENAPSTADQLPGGTALRTVIVDPGHGGDDLGAESPGGALEKDVALAVARKLADSLRARLGCRVVLTRESDIAVSLPERSALATSEDGDLFISLHANASPSPSARGYETFVLSETATDAEAGRVAALENAAGPDGGESFPPSFLQATLQGLMQAESMEESARLAALVQMRLGDVTGSKNRGVKQAPFWVLAGVEMPAVLVELGFMTNAGESRRLSDPAEQARIAGALTEAVVVFRRELDLRRGIAPQSPPVP
ncbi:MAG: N-acetylmuramoyl-L-alanine amidase [Deltaproteobacteria bacterium]|nr:N-acetylmuramoyl-L-alanine amidase [Deltaproteobacteria bacterium]